MGNASDSFLSRRKWVLIGIGLPILFIAWWAFRPEKLWVNVKVNEPPPSIGSAQPQALSTARFKGSSKESIGRATIFKRPDGSEYLALTDFAAPEQTGLQIALLPKNDAPGGPALADPSSGLSLGALKSATGDQSYDVSANADVGKLNAVVIYRAADRSVVAVARLEPF